MTARDPKLSTLLAEIAKIDDDKFEKPDYGWPDDVSVALVDAVFSIRATYNSDVPGKGVLNRLRAFRTEHPDTRNDLRALVELGPDAITRTMGHGKTAGGGKSEAVIAAARALVDLPSPIVTADDVRDANSIDVARAYTSVHGLGKVTCEYFLMLLGKPGVKADRMIVGFVNAALEAADLGQVGRDEARALVVAAYEAEPRGDSLSVYDHAIWLQKRELGVVEDSAG